MIKLNYTAIFYLLICNKIHSCEEPLVASFSLKNATMKEAVTQINDSIKKYKIQSISEVRFECQDKHVVFKELKLNKMAIHDLLKLVCKLSGQYYYEADALPLVYHIKKSYNVDFFMSAHCGFVKNYASKNNKFNFKNDENLRTLLSEYDIIQGKYSTDIRYIGNFTAMFNIPIEKADILSSIISLHDKGFKVEIVK